LVLHRNGGALEKHIPKQPVFKHIFYDSHCQLCFKCVRFALKKKKKVFPFRFSPILGSTFKKMQKKYNWCHVPDGLLLLDTDTGQLFTQGEAVIQLAKELKFPWNASAHVLGLFPKRVVRFFYNLIAKNRRRVCRKPTIPYPCEKQEWKKYYQD
jgi:predicted DCC family thiol-disulfide oxidoreductase YuxK